MKTIEKIIAIFGSIDVTITNEPYMRLVIEHIGDGPHGFPAISVAHYFELNGDLCQDPEMCFEPSRSRGRLLVWLCSPTCFKWLTRLFIRRCQTMHRVSHLPVNCATSRQCGT
jgi:hypothetical protein